MFTEEVMDDYLKVVMGDISNAINKPTVYNTAKEELSFTKIKSQIILLMKKNGLNVNNFRFL